MDEAGVVAKFGVPPTCIPDYLCRRLSIPPMAVRAFWTREQKSTSAVLDKFGHIEIHPGVGRGMARDCAELCFVGSHTAVEAKTCAPLPKLLQLSGAISLSSTMSTVYCGPARMRISAHWALCRSFVAPFSS
jgi:hypothetical protein